MSALTSPSMFSVQIPVIDLKDFNNQERRSTFVESLGNAFVTHGFVAVRNSTIDQSVLQRAYQAVRIFFEQDLVAKQSIQSSTNSGERGYVTGETPKRQPLEVVDFKEILHIGRELTAEQQERLGYPTNLWPNSSTLQDAVMPLFDQLEGIIQPIAEAASEFLGESPNAFPTMMKEGDHLLRFLHYFRDPSLTKNWAAEHTDMNFLTLIPRGLSEGLQVKMKDGAWEDVHIPADAVLINVGDSLEQLTNGFYKSGVHRVVAKATSASERWSVVFHGHVRHDLDMTPLASAINRTGGKQLFAKAKGFELLYAQIAAVGRASGPMLEALAKSGVIDRQIEYGKASEKVMKILFEKGLASDAIKAEIAKQSKNGGN